jgi:hypothetical protein
MPDLLLQLFTESLKYIFYLIKNRALECTYLTVRDLKADSEE